MVGSFDLLIATIAIHHDAELISFDDDFLKIASISPLKIKHLKRPS
jgi:predicted nucleic acid-binding protein